MQRSFQHTILLIEQDKFLRRMIALGLQGQGMRVIEASSLLNAHGLEKQHPEVVILDIDGEAGRDSTLLTLVQAHPLLARLPLVLLAWEYGPDSIPSPIPVACLTKPFDARALYLDVKHALATSAALRSQVAPAPTSCPTPTIWPMVTAAGLLLAFIGLLLQLALTAIGLLIVMVALLWWTLGSRVEPQPVMTEAG
ncbi:MAG TPA: hypothetical protein VFA41_13725 [Ktedonobacteraceae bacterium]|jgi:DNA-binding NtrC family response regulator|nr:hypothetical protein [Ktedonobacteraceae bacterium]